MTRTFPLLVVACLTTACGQGAPETVAAAAAPAEDPIEGAWRLVERKLGAENTLISNPQPGVRLFVDGHSCLVRVDATAPRPLTDSTSTPAQLVAAWGPFTAQCASYRISGDTVVERFFVSKAPGGMTEQSVQTSTFRIVGDTLWYSSIANALGPIGVPGYSRFVRLGGGS